jgi:excisionase family DNA binding protein
VTLGELVTRLEALAVDAEAMQAQAPAAAVIKLVLAELRAVNGSATPPHAPDPAGLEPHLTPEQVAEQLQVPAGYPYRHAHQLGGVKVGKYLRFPESAIRRRLERSRRPLSSSSELS